MKYKELVEKIKNFKGNNLGEFANVDKSLLFLAILEAKRYELFDGSDLKLDLKDDDKVSKRIVLYLLTDENLYDVKYYYNFKVSEIHKIRDIAIKLDLNKDLLNNIILELFENVESKNEFVVAHKDIIIDYINKCSSKYDIPFGLGGLDEFNKILIELEKFDLIYKLDDLKFESLKKILPFILDGTYVVKSFEFDDRVLNEILNNLDKLDDKETYNFLNLFTNERNYKNVFSELIDDKLDLIIERLDNVGSVPVCLINYLPFREKCISGSKYNLLVQCTLPDNLLDDEELAKHYAEELGFSLKEFYSRYKYITNYYKMNNNVFNTCIASMLKDGIYREDTHFERFINDIEFSKKISSLSKNELGLLNKILDLLNYKDYDSSQIIYNIVTNISDYKELVDSLEDVDLSKDDIKDIIFIVQNKGNFYDVKSLDDIRNKKEITFDGTLDEVKNKLCMSLFNIDYEKAKWIDYKYIHDNDNNCILDDLKNSELPEFIYNIFVLMHKVVGANEDSIDIIVENFKDINVYHSFIDIECYLRKTYANLYSKSLLNPNKCSNKKQVNYNGKNVDVVIPEDELNLFIHCVGTCSTAEDVSSENYMSDWCYRPEVMEHIVACSYINYEKLYDIRDAYSIIYGFGSLEGGSLIGMGNCDIDSIGYNTYSASHSLVDDNGRRARYYVPSMMNKYEGYNEFVIERRTASGNLDNFKRKPDYIVMIVDDINKSRNFHTFEETIDKFFNYLDDEIKNKLRSAVNGSEVRNTLKDHIELIRNNIPNIEKYTNDVLLNRLVEISMTTKKYEGCLKAASEFDVPMVLVDRLTYFKKMVNEKEAYDDDNKVALIDMWINAKTDDKAKIWRLVQKNMAYPDIVNKLSPNNKKITIFA